MVENVVTKSFGLVLIVTAHMVFSDPGYSKYNGIVGQNFTFNFTFETNITKHSGIAIYKSIKERKISEYSNFKSSFEVCPEHSSVFYHKTHLTLNDTDVYWAALFGNVHPVLSNKVKLVVREDNRSSTVSPVSTKLPKLERSGSSFAAHVILMVSPVMLLVALLPFFICCLEKTKDRGGPQRGSNPTVQERIEESNNVPGPSLVYSVLDFPKRLPAAVEFHPSGTEYATVSYLTEKRQKTCTEECKHAHRS